MKRIFPLLLAALLLCGCTSATPENFAPGKENRVTVYTCLDEAVYVPLVREFEARTGIWVQTVSGTGTELAEQADDGVCDVVLGLEADFAAANSASFAPVSCTKEALDALCPVSDRFVSVNLRSLVLIYNARLIRQNPPEGLHSLLEASWRGQVAFADPETSDFSRTVLAVLAQELGDEAVTRFSGSLSRLETDTAGVLEAVADGTFCLALVPEDAARRAIAGGAALTVAAPTEGTYRLAQTAAVSASAPHPGCAEAFLTFLQGEDAQQYGREESQADSVLKKYLTPVPGAAALDIAEAGARQEALLALWRAGREVQP